VTDQLFLFGLNPEPLAVGVTFVRSERARNYRLTLRRDGAAVATIPRRGSEREAMRFVEQHRAWLERARARQHARPRCAAEWTQGTTILWRGSKETLRLDRDAGRWRASLGGDVFAVARSEGDLRPLLEARFARLARIELPARTWELAAATASDIKRVVVRSQRSRWGSCSARGTISLNWRLIQTPDFVRDYIIYHELAHRQEMNHSNRFWARVEALCPAWRAAERWLKDAGSLLGL
jgi:predicted metal-dependent hydrolase